MQIKQTHMHMENTPRHFCMNMQLYIAIHVHVLPNANKDMYASDCYMLTVK